jgi:predicted GH43/DUF377 family glycosyl hydrolase
MAGRPGEWDASGVASGPQPERLSTGDYLMLYNIDTGFPYHPNPLGRCAVGWVVLDGADPARIVARAEEPLLVAVREQDRGWANLVRRQLPPMEVTHPWIMGRRAGDGAQ